ncbi:class I adenylate-forming enzyme family protein [Phenylobacterium sp. LjRoot225]|uniref:class I adenylate-forming enzyme family protein n=1 Tax=Phenylobacterium sp. LjRoot225 TaxID=3342285 RepID=UPI003ECE4B33
MSPQADDLSRLRAQTVWRTVLAAAERFPERDALTAADDAGRISRLTYRRLAERIRNLSAGLAHIGVRRGDRAVLWMTNTLEWVVASFAVQRLGATVVPVNTFLKPSEIEYVVAQSGARHLLAIDAFRALRLSELLAEICPRFGAATEPGFLYSPQLPDLRNVVAFNRGGGQHPGAYDLAALEALGAGSPDALALADRLETETQPSDLGMVKYTSGSTGFPKGVMLEQGGIVANAILHSRRIGIGEADVFFSMMPFFHGGGSIWGLMTTMVNGGRLVFTEAFNAPLAADLIAQEGATVMFGVLAEEVVQAAIQKGLSFPTLRNAPVPNADARRLMPNVIATIQPFGLTETYGPAGVTSPDDPPEKRGTSGRMLDGNLCRVVDPETGRDVAPGEVGEAWIRGNIMRGYWNKPEETARALDAEGWLHSEDLVSIDEDGYITYQGRLKLMLKVGGENVSVEEVERIVASHEAVADCGVVGVPDPRKGEAVCAFVALQAGRALADAELRAWLQSRLARFKQPREIIFVDALPRLGNGKLDRVGLQQRADAEVAA